MISLSEILNSLTELISRRLEESSFAVGLLPFVSISKIAIFDSPNLRSPTALNNHFPSGMGLWARALGTDKKTTIRTRAIVRHIKQSPELPEERVSMNIN